jgi:hypothetical protein
LASDKWLSMYEKLHPKFLMLWPITVLIYH